MTKAQEITVEKYRQELNNNCLRNEFYNSSEICKFNVYQSEKDDDKNITIVTVSITGISDDFQPYIGINTLMVEVDGNAFNMNDVYPSKLVNEYVDTLKKIN
jgi:hypothetical protein